MYNIIKYIEKKEERFTALIEYKNKKAILKKLTSKSEVLKNKFLNEINVLKKLNKEYIPKIYETGKDYIIMEYFESKDNQSNLFEKAVDEKLIDSINKCLIDINISKPNLSKENNKPLFNIFKVITKLIKNGYLKINLLKALFLLISIYLKNKKIFLQKATTKGDMTELNILFNETEIKLIDFDVFCENGSWLEDATYLTLHQDKIVKELTWQKIFFNKYLSIIKSKNILINKEYIRFWLIHTSIKQFSIRYNQYNKELIPIEQLQAKEEHIKFFLNDKDFETFLQEIGFNE